jgi:F-type H+-transporting ATPase subunit b
MLINWFTVIAQLVNFLILVLLLKRYLYKPILKAIDDREKKITDKITQAEKQEAEAVKEHDTFKKKNEEFELQRTALLTKATEEAKANEEQLKEKARTEASALKTKLEKVFEEDRKQMAEEIVRNTRKEIFAISGKVLKDLANSSLDKRITQKFITRLKKLTTDEKEKLLKAFGHSTNKITIESAFDLATAQKSLIENEVSQLLGVSPAFNYKVSPKLIAGIELHAKGFKVSWCISDYLRAVESAVDNAATTKAEVSKTENEKT